MARARLSLLLVVCGLAAAGCGGSDSASNTASDAAPTTANAQAQTTTATTQQQSTTTTGKTTTTPATATTTTAKKPAAAKPQTPKAFAAKATQACAAGRRASGRVVQQAIKSKASQGAITVKMAQVYARTTRRLAALEAPAGLRSDFTAYLAARRALGAVRLKSAEASAKGQGAQALRLLRSQAAAIQKTGLLERKLKLTTCFG
jgi:hypothetical protein